MAHPSKEDITLEFFVHLRGYIFTVLYTSIQHSNIPIPWHNVKCIHVILYTVHNLISPLFKPHHLINNHSHPLTKYTTPLTPPKTPQYPPLQVPYPISPQNPLHLASYYLIKTFTFPKRPSNPQIHTPWNQRDISTPQIPRTDNPEQHTAPISWRDVIAPLGRADPRWCRWDEVRWDATFSQLRLFDPELYVFRRFPSRYLSVWTWRFGCLGRRGEGLSKFRVGPGWRKVGGIGGVVAVSGGTRNIEWDGRWGKGQGGFPC